MNHLKTHELVLFASNWPQLIDALKEKQKHLKSCATCKQQVNFLDDWLNLHKAQNYQTCNIILDRLFLIIDENSNAKLPYDLIRHLENCDRCKLLYQSYINTPSVEEVADMPVEIPPHAFDALDQKIYSLTHETTPTKAENLVRESIDSIKNLVDKKFQELELILSPIPALEAIRGQAELDFQILMHRGGPLRLRTKLSQKTVRLHAIFHDKTYEKLTDNYGNVEFDNLLEDDYRVRIDGYEVCNINELVFS